MKPHICLVLTLAIAVAGCAATDEKAEGQIDAAPSVEYELATAKTDTYRCPPGYVLRCETRRMGRIRFSSIGRKNLESCSCEENVMPIGSPLPGIY